MAKTRRKIEWRKPEKITGGIFLALIFTGMGVLASIIVPNLAFIINSTLWLTISIVALAGIVYVLLDPKMRALVTYGYKSMIRWITALFVEIDPIGVLKAYVEDLNEKIRHMKKQINKLRGQKHQLAETIHKNNKLIVGNLEQAKKAREANDEQNMILKSRKAGRLQESNQRLEALYKKMEVLYQVLDRMLKNSVILAEDTKDQVAIKEQERNAIQASTSAMRSARSIIQGDKDKLAMFNQALEAIADDVGEKVGEMERFMTVSSNFMDSIDLQNGVFEEEGLNMLEKWQKESMTKILGMEEKQDILQQANDAIDVLDLNQQPVKQAEKNAQGNQYDSFFE